ncbi:MAG: SRPBCC family protein [Planctomycetota bacterium]
MQVNENTLINATPDQVWPFLIDPVLQAAWNPKIISIDRPKDGPVTLGEAYGMTAKLSGEQRTTRVEVVDLIEAQLLMVQHQLTETGTGFLVTETFTLEPNGAETRVEHNIDLSQTPIPGILKPLIKLVMKFAKPPGSQQLGRLKQMIESEVGG